MVTTCECLWVQRPSLAFTVHRMPGVVRPAEKIVLADSKADAQRAGYQTPNVIACYLADGSK